MTHIHILEKPIAERIRFAFEPGRLYSLTTTSGRVIA